MKRRYFLGLMTAAAVLVSVPAAALAQTGPPPPPTTYYGTVSGAAAGQKVIAIVKSGGISQTCGSGTVLNSGGNIVYVVDVIQDGQLTGCGAAGRQVTIYVAPGSPGQGGRVATTSVNWQSPGAPVEANFTLGNPLGNRQFMPQIAGDGN